MDRARHGVSCALVLDSFLGCPACPGRSANGTAGSFAGALHLATLRIGKQQKDETYWFKSS